MEADHKICSKSFAWLYPFYVAKAERKGRNRAEVDAIICWLTGYRPKELELQLKAEVDVKSFFSEAPRLNPLRLMISGSICGVKVQEVQNPTMREIRILDKLVDELAKGKSLEKLFPKQ